MPVCIQKIKNQRVSCSHMILQCKSCQRNLTASRISKINYNYQLRTLKKNVTYIDFLAHPGPNVPYVGWQITLSRWTGISTSKLEKMSFGGNTRRLKGRLILWYKIWCRKERFLSKFVNSWWMESVMWRNSTIYWRLIKYHQMLRTHADGWKSSVSNKIFLLLWNFLYNVYFWSFMNLFIFRWLKIV